MGAERRQGGVLWLRVILGGRKASVDVSNSWLMIEKAEAWRSGGLVGGVGGGVEGIYGSWGGMGHGRGHMFVRSCVTRTQRTVDVSALIDSYLGAFVYPTATCAATTIRTAMLPADQGPYLRGTAQAARRQHPQRRLLRRQDRAVQVTCSALEAAGSWEGAGDVGGIAPGGGSELKRADDKVAG